MTTSQLTFNKATSTFVGKASKVSLPAGATLNGVELVSHKTGAVKLFTLKQVNQQGGELQSVEFACEGMTLVILND